MHHLRVARPDNGRAQPRVLWHHEISIEIAILQRAGRGNFLRLGQLNDEVRLAELPRHCGRRGAGERVFAVTSRTALLNPVEQRVRFGGGERAVVRKLSVMRIGVPRRHPAVQQHLFDHRRPALDLLVTRHRERSNLPRAVATDTILLQQRRNLAAEGNRFLRGFRLEGDATAMNLRLGGRDRFAREKFLDCVDEILLRRRRLLRAFHALVVNRAAINDRQVLRINGDGFARARDSKDVSDQLPFIAQHRQRADGGLEHLLAQRVGVFQREIRHEIVLP